MNKSRVLMVCLIACLSILLVSWSFAGTNVAAQQNETTEQLVAIKGNENIAGNTLNTAGQSLGISVDSGQPLKSTNLDIFLQNQTYVVQAGDTLTAIALQFGTTVQALVTLNNIANPNLIYVGQVLQIPGGGTGGTPPATPPATPPPSPPPDRTPWRSPPSIGPPAP